MWYSPCDSIMLFKTRMKWTKSYHELHLKISQCNGLKLKKEQLSLIWNEAITIYHKMNRPFVPLGLGYNFDVY